MELSVEKRFTVSDDQFPELLLGVHQILAGRGELFSRGSIPQGQVADLLQAYLFAREEIDFTPEEMVITDDMDEIMSRHRLQAGVPDQFGGKEATYLISSDDYGPTIEINKTN